MVQSDVSCKELGRNWVIWTRCFCIWQAIRRKFMALHTAQQLVATDLDSVQDFIQICLHQHVVQLHSATQVPAGIAICMCMPVHSKQTCPTPDYSTSNDSRCPKRGEICKTATLCKQCLYAYETFQLTPFKTTADFVYWRVRLSPFQPELEHPDMLLSEQALVLALFAEIKHDVC